MERVGAGKHCNLDTDSHLSAGSLCDLDQGLALSGFPLASSVRAKLCDLAVGMGTAVVMVWWWVQYGSGSVSPVHPRFSSGTERKRPSPTQLTCITRTVIYGGHSEMTKAQHAADHDGAPSSWGDLERATQVKTTTVN